MGHLRRVAAAILIDSGGRMLIAKRPEGGSLAGFWEFPGGKVEETEEPLEALERELREELGISGVRGELIRSERNTYGPDRFEVDYFIVKEWSGRVASSHYADLRWVSPSELDRYDHLSGNRDLCDAIAAGEYEPIIRPLPPPHLSEP